MSSSAVPITVAVVISVLFCSIRVYYWYKARARPPPYSSDSSYDIENQAMMAGAGSGGQPLDYRPSSPPTGTGGTTLTILTSADLHPHTSGSKAGRKSPGLPVARPSSSLYHAVIRTVSFPAQQPTAAGKASSSAARGAAAAAGSAPQQASVGLISSPPADTTPTSSPSGSPCVSSTGSHNNSSETIHSATPPSKQNSDAAPDSTTTPATTAAPVPGLIQTAVSGSWLAVLRHQKYTRVASPATPTPTTSSSPSPPPIHPTAGLVPANDSRPAPAPSSPTPVPLPMLVVQPCTPRPFAFHAPSPSPTSPSPASVAPIIVKSRARRHTPRHKSAGGHGHGPMNLFRQMYTATPPLVETDEEDEEGSETRSERTGSGTSIVSESGDSFADSLVERGRLLPAGGGSGKTRRAVSKREGGGREKGGAGGKGARGGSVDRCGNAVAVGQADADVLDRSVSGSLDEDEDTRGNEGEEKPITGAGARAAANEDVGLTKSAKSLGKGRKVAKGAEKGSASPKSVKSVKSISKKRSKRSRRMSV